MQQFANLMEIFKLLDKSNCNQCNQKTCLAFAAAVFKGQKTLDECPKLPQEVIAKYHTAAPPEQESFNNPEAATAITTLQKKVCRLDLSQAAQRTGANYTQGKLTLKILGKNFHINQSGMPSSDIHINPWILLPVFSYLVNAVGTSPNGKWASFRELKGGAARYGLFRQRCEQPLQKLADSYTDLFEDLIHLFNGRQVNNHYESDIALVLSPLPKLPILICYWKPEDGLDSSLNIFFDETADRNLDIGSIFSLCAGLVTMFEKIVLRHGHV